jgi:phosphoglycerate dehydrogenase-like enzyme
MNKDCRIVVALPMTEKRKRYLQGAAPHAEFVWRETGNVTEEDIREAEVLIGNFPPAILPAAGKVRLYQAGSAGVDPFVKPGVLPAEASICSAVGAYNYCVAEHMLALTLAGLRHLPELRDAQKKHQWENVAVNGTLHGATVLVLGIGSIGQIFAEYCTVMGAHVIGFRRHAGAPTAGAEKVCTMDELDAWLPKADVVAMCLPDTPETRHTINRDRLAKMKSSAVLVNCGRGSAVDGEALADALERHMIAAAALDVTEPEPLPADSRLWEMPNCLITPHTAGGFRIPETVDRIVDIAAENLRHYFAGEPLRNLEKR